MTIAGKAGAVYLPSGASVAVTGQGTTADVAKKRYGITNRARAYWDKDATVTVKKDGVIQTSGFTLEYAGGFVVFAVALTVEVVTVDISYFNVAEVANFFDWKLDLDVDLKDVTTFASNGWREILPITKGWSASAEGFWADGSFAGKVGTAIILVLYVDEAGADRYEGYVYLKKNGIQTPADDVIKETVDFEGTGQLYFREVA